MHKINKDARCERIIADSEVYTDYIGMDILHPYMLHLDPFPFHSAYELYESNQYCGMLTFKREMLYFIRCCFIVCMRLLSISALLWRKLYE